MIRPSLVLLALLLGCSADPAPKMTPAEADLAAAVPALATFDEAAFPCCASERALRLVEEYLDLGRALAIDDLASARAELQTLRGVALAAAEDQALSGHSRGLARQVAGLLEPVAEGSLDQLRGVFVDVSERVIVLAQANKGGERKVAVALCTSTNANWLQAEPTLANPFLGAADPTAGTFRP